METGSSPGSRATDPKVRIRKELYEALWKISNATPRGEGASVTAMIERVVEEWLGGSSKQPERPPSSTFSPNTEEERLLVAGLLLLFRDKREIAAGPKEVVAGLLSNWIDKAKDKLNGGKRSA